MAEFFDFDPLSGVKRTFDYDEGRGDFIVRSEQDVGQLLKETAEARATGQYDSPRKEFKFYASLPPVVQIALRAKGIDIYSQDPTMIRRMFAEIDANYPLLKMTEKRHAG
jgi:hypothetical protein